MFKRFMRSSLAQSVIGFCVAAYMVLVKYTTRWEVLGLERVDHLFGNGEGLICMTWHSRFLMLNAAWSKKYQLPHVLISRSRDGEIVARASHFLGLKTVRGSARRAFTKKGGKGGAAAFREMLSVTEAGHCVVITPDGPKGPRQRLGEGPLRLAQLSGAPLVSCVFAVKNRKQLKSWDRFILPIPFGGGTIIWGTPASISKTASEEELAEMRTALEAEMNANMARADKLCGHEPCEPVDLNRPRGRSKSKE
jgi:lysophospholipid acyltransferase (LPLAT)-like uncharacterized protein